MEILFIADLLTNELQEKVMMYSICYITISRLHVQPFKKIALEMIIGQ